MTGEFHTYKPKSKGFAGGLKFEVIRFTISHRLNLPALTTTFLLQIKGIFFKFPSFPSADQACNDTAKLFMQSYSGQLELAMKSVSLELKGYHAVHKWILCGQQHNANSADSSSVNPRQVSFALPLFAYFDLMGYRVSACA